jgi:GAF domain-containing protein
VLARAEPVQHALSDGRIQQALAGADGADGLDQVAAADLLEDVVGGASHDRGEPAWSPAKEVSIRTCVLGRHARELVGADLATLAVPASPGELLVGAASGLHADELAGTTFPIEGSVSGEVIQTGKTVAVADATTDQGIRQPAPRAGGIGPALFAPLAVRGAGLGTLRVANAAGGRPFGEGDVQLTETFAEQAAVAVEHARLQ